MNFEYPNEEIVEIDGKKYRKVPTQWTERQYFSHDGPSWDSREAYLERRGIDPYDQNYLDKLSDEPYYLLEEVEE